MTSEAKANANRRNAEKSTGPKTEEGKAAVSQNAVKHGLLARQEVISSEDYGEFERLRDEILAEFQPVGAIETLLAKRYASLFWRVQRAQRMQNEAVDYLTGSYQPSPYIEMLRTMLPKGAYMSQDDPDLRLGKEAVKDLANERVLERLSLYERRLENSLHRTMTEFYRWRLMRQTEAIEEPTAKAGPQEAEETKPNAGSRPEAGDRRPEEPGGSACETKPNPEVQVTGCAEETALAGVKTQELPSRDEELLCKTEPNLGAPTAQEPETKPPLAGTE